MIVNAQKKIVLVLANLMNKDGVLNEETEARVNLAYKVFVEANNDCILFIGWDYRTDSKIAIADAMKNYLINKTDITNDKILVNRYSRDSVGDAVLSRLHIEQFCTNYELSVVSSRYHIPRLRQIFTRVYTNSKKIRYFGADIKVDNQILETENASMNAFNLTFEGIADGDLEKFAERMVKSHPYYNGDIHPVLKLDNLNMFN